jgi:drug/metabolite transporter superfamily protein YnfA
MNELDEIARLNTFLWGALSMACIVVGLIFLRFWKKSGDRLFAIFCGAFWVLSLNWILLVTGHPTDETRHYFYVVRLIAFLLIIAGIIDKNRSTRDD